MIPEQMTEPNVDLHMKSRLLPLSLSDDFADRTAHLSARKFMSQYKKYTGDMNVSDDVKLEGLSRFLKGDSFRRKPTN